MESALRVSQHLIMELGVAVDDDTGNIFIAGTNKIVKLTPDLQLIKEIASDSSCMGIAVVKNEVFVCNKGCLVYNKNLAPKRIFFDISDEVQVTDYPCNVCPDEDDNLYFTNCGHLCVQLHPESNLIVYLCKAARRTAAKFYLYRRMCIRWLCLCF